MASWGKGCANYNALFFVVVKSSVPPATYTAQYINDEVKNNTKINTVARIMPFGRPQILKPDCVGENLLNVFMNVTKNT